jgi:hypothetical protein
MLLRLVDWLIFSRPEGPYIYRLVSHIHSHIHLYIYLRCSSVCTDMSRSVLIRAALLRHIFIHQLHIKRTWGSRCRYTCNIRGSVDSEWYQKHVGADSSSTLHTASLYTARTKVHTTMFTCFPRVWCSGITQPEVRPANHRLCHTAIIAPNYTRKEVEPNLRKLKIVSCFKFVTVQLTSNSNQNLSWGIFLNANKLWVSE